MKTTRLILAFAAALSLGLAVFANIRANNYAASTARASYQLTTNLAASSSPVDRDGCPYDTDNTAGAQIASDDQGHQTTKPSAT